MQMHIDTSDNGPTPETSELLATLDDSTFVSLGVLFGADLCVLGGASHPTCWEPLKTAWQQLDPSRREQLTETSTQAMRDRDLLIEQPAGRGVAALVNPGCYKMSSKLRILLSARNSPRFLIATKRADRDAPQSPRSPLDVMFSYRLSTPAFAAAELARWALKPVPAARFQPKPPRLIGFFGRTERGRRASCQLTIHRNGKKAHVDAPDVSADFTSQQLTRFLASVVTEWADSRRPIVSLSPAD